jgi:hypothetical protein
MQLISEPPFLQPNFNLDVFRVFLESDKLNCFREIIL